MKNASPKKDFAAVKFDVAEALGEWMNCLYLKGTTDGKELFEFIHHRDADGVSGITEILLKEGHAVTSQPGLKMGKKPGMIFRLRALKKYINLTKRIPIRWKRKRRDITGIPAKFALAVLSEEETLLLHDRAKMMGVSLNSFLLWGLDKVVHENLLEEDSARKWVAPLNMRPADSDKFIMGNYSSSIVTNIEAASTPSPQDIHQTIKDYLKEGIHWGSQIYSNMARFIGFKGTLKVAKNIKEVGTGVFSNVGIWPHEGVELRPDGLQVKWRGVLAPSTQILPVAGTVWQWQKTLSLTLQLHPSIGAPNDQCCDLLNAWLTTLLEEKRSTEAALRNWAQYPQCPKELIRDSGTLLTP